MYDSQASRNDAENYQFMGLIDDIAGASGVSGSLYGRIQEPSLLSEPSVQEKIDSKRNLLQQIDFSGGTQTVVEDRITAQKPPMQKMRIVENSSAQKNFVTAKPKLNQDLTSDFAKNFGDGFVSSDSKKKFQTVKQKSSDINSEYFKIPNIQLQGRIQAEGSQASTGRSRHDQLALGLMTLGYHHQEDNLQHYLEADAGNQDFQLPEDNNSLISDIPEQRYGTLQAHQRFTSVMEIPRSNSQQRVSTR